ncbi:hypothetical protein OE09_0397 [Flavobacteriaceae bacterium MAR_2010_72]|nr:hypothetical protein OE09_0397 [Flavobacteriaceae bacterium MAR_2010_72]
MYDIYLINKLRFFFSIFTVLFLLSSCNKSQNSYFKIKVVDSETSKGVPLVGLIPLTQVKYYTDSNGFIAFNESGLMDKEVYFEISTEGYEYPLSEEGKRAITLFCKAGDSVIVKLRRKNVAERLYRSTGLGIYRDSKLLGETIPIENPIINAEVLGQDSNLATVYNNEIFWVWGDTFLPSNYNGNFSVAAATSLLPEQGGLNPNVGVNYNYFVDETGKSKPMIKLTKPGYVWFDWIASIKDENGTEKLVAKYANVNSYFANYERGIAIYNDENQQFENHKAIPEWMSEQHTCQHPFFGLEDDQEFMYLTTEFNFLKVKPTLNDLASPENYYAFTCLKEGSKFNGENPELERDSNGNLIYDWKLNTDAIDFKKQQQLITNGQISKEEAWLQLTNINTGETIERIGRGSIYWNEFRQKWILICGDVDIWFAEADSPIGPWVYAKKIVEHKSFLYNPTHHPFLDQNGGKDIFFEGTFTKFFSDEEKVPRYDYNQLFYKLSLEDEQTFLPSAVYKVNNQYDFRDNLSLNVTINDIEEIGFYALQPHQNVEGLIPIYQSEDKNLSLSGNNPLFYAVPNDIDENKKFLGTWETKVDFPHFNNTFNITIKEENDKLIAISNKEDFKISKFQIKNDSINLTFVHPEGIYDLKANVKNGKLNGNWKIGSYKGKWEGTITSKKWWALYSDALVNLYEFKNDDSVYYSTMLEPKKGFTRQSVPICKVWNNPNSKVITSFNIKPTQ